MPREELLVSLTFYIVDVFAEEKYAGNQLAVIRGGAELPEEMLQKITLEMNYSETTFVLSEEESDGGYDVRVFTPGGEVPFAGHPTLGTAYVIRQEILGEPVERITLNLKASKTPVTFGEVLWMRQLPPTFGATLDPAPVARALNLEIADLDDRFPVQEVSTGLPAIVVPLGDLDALRSARSTGNATRRSPGPERTCTSSARNRTRTDQATSPPACSRTTSAFPKTPRPAAPPAAWPDTWSNTATSGPTP